MGEIMKKWEFYLLSFSWGIIMTLVGCIISAVLILTGHKPVKNLYSWTFEIGENWGGLELGICSIVCKNASQHLRNHEFGHAIQNCYFGPFMIFISLASAIRYWYREFIKHKPNYKPGDLPSYDSIWFEGSASILGDFYFNYLKKDIKL